MQTINIKAHTTDDSQIDAIKAFMSSLKIKFELAKENQSSYNSKFVKKINESDAEFAFSIGIKMSLSEFKIFEYKNRIIPIILTKYIIF